MKQLMIEERVPVFLKEPSYDERLKKKSHKARKHTYDNFKDKKLPCLEWGNAAVVFQFAYDEQLYEDLVLWWESEYALKELDFDVELFLDGNALIEVRIMCDSPYYKSRRKGFESVLVNIQANVLEAWGSVPEGFRQSVELCYLSDWDFLEYGEEELI